jgi:hypothetical protein
MFQKESKKLMPLLFYSAGKNSILKSLECKYVPDYLQASANLGFIDSMNSRGRLVFVFFKLKNELKKGEINFFPQQ